MTLTIGEKIRVVEDKILEAERVIRYTRNPSEEDIDAQILNGIREQIIEQVIRKTQAIELFNSILNDLKNGIDQIG